MSSSFQLAQGTFGTTSEHGLLTTSPFFAVKHPFTLALLLSLPLLLNTGCSKEENPLPEPTPQATATYRRTFFYPANSAVLDTVYAALLLRAVAGQDANELNISIGTTKPDENVNFRIERSRIKPGTAGTYSLKTAQSPGQGDASVTYYCQSGSGGYLYFSTANRLTGSLTVTGYDAARKLLSGRYTVELPDASDPTAAPTTFPKQRCNITLTGTFDNVLVTE